MIAITRVLARQLRAVLRKAVPIGSGRGPRPPLVLHADQDGLHVRAQHPEVAVEFHLPGDRPADVLALPAEALDDFEGRKDESISLEMMDSGTVQARWNDGGMPQVREYTAPDQEKLPPFPEEPKKLAPVNASLLKALDDACHTAARDSSRFAVQKLQLKGGVGEIVATDGRQILIQGGFAFPWKEDVLIPAVGAFACRELPQDGSVAVGRTDKHVCIRVGPWTFYLSIDADGRFPEAKTVIPLATASATTCRLTREDAAFLVKALIRLPGRDDDNATLTLDLNGHVAVRAKAEGQNRPTEVVLSHSEVVGPPVCFVSKRTYLTRAVQLGFTEFRVAKPDVPVVCQDGFKTYVWITLGKEGALPPSDDVLRVTSAGDEPATPQPKKERSTDAMTKPPGNDQGNGHAPLPSHSDNNTATNSKGLGSLIAEAQSLKDVLRDAYDRSNKLVAALKRQRQQSRLVQSTLTALRQLQHIDG